MAKFTGIIELDSLLTRLKLAQSRDEHDEVMGELSDIAPQHIEVLDELYDANIYYRMPLIWSLLGQTTTPAIELFSKAINDKDQYTRWAAATGLSGVGTREASYLLVAALKDRSHLVKGIAVDAMLKFRDPAAVPQLKKIIESEYLQKNAPGIVSSARKALRVCNNAR